MFSTHFDSPYVVCIITLIIQIFIYHDVDTLIALVYCDYLLAVAAKYASKSCWHIGDYAWCIQQTSH